ncbi:hypothetical protein [Kitasatospora sp. NPDC002965]|uniref:hypothetical protein n=1 Tax=Kitasatospora sp. NPDC002965 TaxID=3154775 RepID=UPI0033A1F5D5
MTDTIYSDTATKAYSSEWAGEKFTVVPIPAGSPGIHLLAKLIGIDTPAATELPVEAVKQAATDTGRQPQQRTLLRVAAQLLDQAHRDSTVTATGWQALVEAREHLVRAWKVAPGAWGFSSSPDGTAQCNMCGNRSPDLRQDTTAPYAAETVLKDWYDAHSDLCQPLPRPRCRGCDACGGCAAAPSPIHSCNRCICHDGDHE